MTGRDEITSPVVWRRWLSSELVRLRTRAKLTQRDAAHALHCSVGKLSYLESGDRVVTQQDLKILLPLYKVPRERWPEYLDAAEAADQEGWWDEWSDEDLPRGLLRYVGLEDAAQHIRTYNPSIIDGLLQTSEYASAILEGVWQTAPERVARITRLRKTRQAILTREPNPAEMHIVLDEAALRRRIGGADVMRRQMEHLARLADELPNLTVQVLPFDAGAHGGIYGPFWIFKFVWADDAGVVAVENPAEMSLLESRSDVYLYSAIFTQLVDLALDPDESLAFMQSTAQEYS